MTIHSKYENEIMILSTDNFPYGWKKHKTLIQGMYCDPLIYKRDSVYYLICSKDDSTTELFYSENIVGPYKEHPKSPIVKGNKSIARSAGNIFTINSRVFRPVQDCSKMYGQQVRLMEITQLNKDNYQEHECEYSPVFLQNTSEWRSYRMHTMNVYDVREDGSFKIIADGDNIADQTSRLKELPNYNNLKIKIL